MYALRFGALVAGIGCVLLPFAGFAIDIPEGTNKLQLASEIDRRYINPLGLKGKTAAQAIEVMLGEGFRCNLEPFSALGLDEPPLSRCVKQPSGFGALCDEQLVALRLERLSGIATRSDLLGQLNSIKVYSAMSFCPYKAEASAEYLAARSGAEEALWRNVETLHVMGQARSAFDRLLLEGFSCGFTIEETAEGSANSPQLSCTKRPSGIKFCFESKLIMDIEWPPGTLTMKQLFGTLPSAQIKAVRSRCETPKPSGAKGRGI